MRNHFPYQMYVTVVAFQQLQRNYLFSMIRGVSYNVTFWQSFRMGSLVMQKSFSYIVKQDWYIRKMRKKKDGTV